MNAPTVEQNRQEMAALAVGLMQEKYKRADSLAAQGLLADAKRALASAELWRERARAAGAPV